jgi:nardilysin
MHANCVVANLQARGWAMELCAGVDDDGYSANSAAYLFTVSIVLTEAGLAAGPGCGLAPVALLFQYLKLLTETGALAACVLCLTITLHFEWGVILYSV